MSLGWRISWARRRAWRRVCRRLYRDARLDPARAMILAGTARSGTTWAGDLVRAQLPCRVMFEPFHSRLVPEYAAFSYFQYMRPDARDERLESFARSVLSGTIRNDWIDREVDHLLPRWRLVKDIRANLLLCWLSKRFPATPIAFLMRHPCAVVLSRMELGWDTHADLEPMLSQERLVEDHLAPHVDFVERLTHDEELHAAIWSISNMVPLRQFEPGALPLFHYEHLCDDPEREITRLMAALGQPCEAAGVTRAARPSLTSRSGSAVVSGGDRVAAWTRRLDPEQVRRILTVVERFGLGHLYGDSPRPKGAIAS